MASSSAVDGSDALGETGAELEGGALAHPWNTRGRRQQPGGWTISSAGGREASILGGPQTRSMLIKHTSVGAPAGFEKGVPSARDCPRDHVQIREHDDLDSPVEGAALPRRRCWQRVGTLRSRPRTGSPGARPRPWSRVTTDRGPAPPKAASCSRSERWKSGTLSVCPSTWKRRSQDRRQHLTHLRQGLSTFLVQGGASRGE